MKNLAEKAKPGKEEAAARLEELGQEIMERLLEARTILMGNFDGHWERAKRSWWGDMRIALDNDHNYIGRASCTLAETVDDMMKEAAKEDLQPVKASASRPMFLCPRCGKPTHPGDIADPGPREPYVCVWCYDGVERED